MGQSKLKRLHLKGYSPIFDLPRALAPFFAPLSRQTMNSKINHTTSDTHQVETETIRPIAQGLYDPANEHDACGVGFVAHIKGKKSHAIVTQGLQILEN